MIRKTVTEPYPLKRFHRDQLEGIISFFVGISRQSGGATMALDGVVMDASDMPGELPLPRYSFSIQTADEGLAMSLDPQTITYTYDKTSEKYERVILRLYELMETSLKEIGQAEEQRSAKRWKICFGIEMLLLSAYFWYAYSAVVSLLVLSSVVISFVSRMMAHVAVSIFYGWFACNILYEQLAIDIVAGSYVEELITFLLVIGASLVLHFRLEGVFERE